jgi:hypothetical protein
VNKFIIKIYMKPNDSQTEENASYTIWILWPGDPKQPSLANYTGKQMEEHADCRHGIEKEQNC